MMRKITVILGAAAVALSVPAAAQEHEHAADDAGPARVYDNLGSHHYPVTTSVAQAQQYFDQGLRLAWAFNHLEAIRSFGAGEAIDSSCAMCAWGIGYALGPNINAPMSAESERHAHQAIERAVARRSSVSEAERALIDAMALRYGADPEDGQRASRDTAYARSLQQAAARFPEDDEILTLAAEALMDLSPWVYWEADSSPRPDTPQILRYLETVQQRNPDHPGACHLYIHLVEAVHPERAVACAERLAELMPGAGHLVHMPAHIYIRVGRWQDAVETNQHAVHADEQYFEGGVSRMTLYGQGYAPHNWHFMTFAATMAGQGSVALDAARKTTAAIDPAMAAMEPLAEVILPTAVTTMVTFGRWDDVLANPLPDPSLRYATAMAWYARGVASAATGDIASARQALDSVRSVAGSYRLPEMDQALGVAVAALAGEIHLRQGHLDPAIVEFQRAVELEDAISYMEPPWWYYPMRHSLGAALLRAGRAAEAEEAYREDLARFPGNGWSLIGLAKSLEAQDKLDEAAAVKKLLAEAWSGADVSPAESRF